MVQDAAGTYVDHQCTVASYTLPFPYKPQQEALLNQQNSLFGEYFEEENYFTLRSGHNRGNQGQLFICFISILLKW